MHILSTFGTPLLFLAILSWFFSTAERPAAWRIFFRGALMAIPAALVWKLLSFTYNPAWGSFLLALTFCLKFWLIPYALAIGSWCILYGWSKLDQGCMKPLSSFFAGFMSVFAIVFTFGLWKNSYGAWLLALPLLSICTTFIIPFAIKELACDYMPSGIRWILAILGVMAAASITLAMFFLRLEWLAIVCTALFCGGCSLFVIERYKRGLPGMTDVRTSSSPV